MTATRIGYARCSTHGQDLAAQREALVGLGVAEDRIYTDHGLTGTSRARPGLDQALAAVRAGDTLVVPKLDRLARSVPDARAIADELERRGVKLALGASVHDPTDPMGRMFFNILPRQVPLGPRRVSIVRHLTAVVWLAEDLSPNLMAWMHPSGGIAMWQRGDLRGHHEWRVHPRHQVRPWFPR